MKKIFKSFLLVVLAVSLSFSLVACKKKISATTVDTSKVKTSYGKTTNGGTTVAYGDYLYFINGTKTNDGKSLDKNTRSAICRVKYNVKTGKTSGDMEVVVDDLVGYKNGSLHIFGDFLYYATPCASENSKGDILYNKVDFKRYDLVNKKSYTLYTTQLNNSSETVSYAYYVVGESLNLLVYEATNATITSLKIDKKVKENYVIEEVASCLFSENYGKVTTSGASVDANSYVYYSMAPDKQDAVQTGRKVYKTSPVEKNGVLISQGKDISLLSIRAGKLVYSYGTFIYAQKITSSKNETLATENTNCISFATLDNAIYLENYSLQNHPTENGKMQLKKSEGSISVLALTKQTDSAYYINIFEWTSTTDGQDNLTEEIAFLSSAKDFSFIGLATLTEVVTEDDPETDGDDTVTKDVLYAFFMESSIVYKIEIAEAVKDSTDLNVSGYSEKIQLSATKVNTNDGLLVPEIIGDFMFILAADDDKNNYLYKVDVTPVENETDNATKFSKDEKVDKKDDK